MKKILFPLLLIPFLSRSQVPLEKWVPHAYYEWVKFPTLTASLPLQLDAAKKVVSAKILLGEADTTIGVGIIGWPRMAKLRDSLAALISGGGGGTPGGSTGNVQWNNGGAFAGFGTTNGTYLNIAGGIAAAGTRNYTGTTVGLSVSGGRGALDAYNAGGAVYVPIDYFATEHNFKISVTEKMKIVAGGVSIGGVAVSAYLTLPAGTSTAGTGPLKLTSGPLLATTEAGVFEFDGTHVYFTMANGGTRYQLDQQTGGMTNPLTTTGDIIYSSSGTTPARRGIGSTNQVLQVMSGVPNWGYILEKGFPVGSGLTSDVNIDALSINGLMYTRTEDVVTYSFQLTLDPTANATLTTCHVAVPIASNFSQTYHATGTVTCGTTTGNTGSVTADTGTDELIINFISNGTSSVVLTVTGQYRIL